MVNKQEEKIEHGLKLIAQSSVIVFIGIVISKLSLYAFRAIIARYFGPESYGMFSLSLIFLNLCVAIAMIGLSEGVLRYIIIFRGKKQKDKITFIFSRSQKFIIYSSILISLILFIFSKTISQNIFHSEDFTIFLKITSIIIPFVALSNLYLAVIRAYEKITVYSFLINIFQNILKLLILIMFIFWGFKSDSIMYSFLMSAILLMIVSYYFCRLRILEIFGKNNLNLNEKKEITKEVAIYSIPLMFSSILVAIYYWIDSFVIGYFKSVSEVGFYNTAVPIALLISIIPDLFIQLFYPLITINYAKKDYKSVEDLSKQVAKWIFIITLPVFLLIFLFPGAVINILFGKEYLLAETALRILTIGSFISILSGLMTTILMTAGKSKTVLINLIVTSAINLILNILLVPKYGLIGAAIATSSVWVILTLVLFIEVKKVLNFTPLRRKMIKIAVISLIPLAILILIKPFFEINIISLIVLTALFLLIYFNLILISKSLDKNDLVVLESFVLKLNNYFPFLKMHENIYK